MSVIICLNFVNKTAERYKLYIPENLRYIIMTICTMWIISAVSSLDLSLESKKKETPDSYQDKNVTQ